MSLDDTTLQSKKLMNSKLLRTGVALAFAVLTYALATRYYELWNLTRFAHTVGDALHGAEVAREQSLFAASLVAREPNILLPNPVIGVGNGTVADTYGEPRGGDRLHEGSDIFAPEGTYIRSATDGIVLRAGKNNLGGYVLFILGPGGERYYYAHLNSIDPLIEAGMRVGTTTLLGTVGTTGNASGTPPHLHFGIYAEGGTQNPYPRLP